MFRLASLVVGVGAAAAKAARPKGRKDESLMIARTKIVRIGLEVNSGVIVEVAAESLRMMFCQKS